jgi:hypothetical protein
MNYFLFAKFFIEKYLKKAEEKKRRENYILKIKRRVLHSTLLAAIIKKRSEQHILSR